MSVTPAFPPAHLRARGLTVRRGERDLFAALDLDVAPGGVLLLTGRNGAGKTTLLLALAGIVRPEAGVVEDPGPAALHLLSDRHGLKARLTVAENLGFWQAVNGGAGLDIAAALDTVGIGGLAGLETGYLSSGQTRRLALARLLVSARPVWLLDEPAATLDTDGVALLGRLLDAHRAQGGLAVVATHQDLPLADAGAVATLRLGDAA